MIELIIIVTNGYRGMDQDYIYNSWLLHISKKAFQNLECCQTSIPQTQSTRDEIHIQISGIRFTWKLMYCHGDTLEL